MSTFHETLSDMRGQVLMHRPDASAVLVDTWLNQRIRQALATRTYWTDLITKTLIQCVDAYLTGTVSVTLNSQVVTGVATAWPVNDLVATTLSSAILDNGYQEATPASMSGITEDSLLYIGGASPEAVAVVQVKPSSFVASFRYAHAAASAITCSSLAGRQFRIANGYPVFTIQAVTAATSLILDMPWSTAALATQAYRVIKMYYTIDPLLKDILAVVDPQWGLPLRLHEPVSTINWRDPQRSASGPPQVVIDLGPSASGNMQYEIWPTQTAARSLWTLFYKQWPELVRDLDRPPWFINPSTFVYGAIADSLRWKKDAGDIYFSPQLAEVYEARYQQAVEDAKNEDASKYQREYQYDVGRVFGMGGGNFAIANDPSVSRWEI